MPPVATPITLIAIMALSFTQYIATHDTVYMVIILIALVCQTTLAIFSAYFDLKRAEHEHL